MTDRITEIKSLQGMAWSRENRARIGALYQSLTVEEGRQLAIYAIDLLDHQDERQKNRAENLLGNLTCLTPGALNDFHQELVKRQVLYPGTIYREASSAISSQLVNLTPVTLSQANRLLTALAWIGDTVVQQAFRQWRETPPDWASWLYISPDAYAQVAGWILTPEAERRNLFLMQCYPLVEPKSDADYLKSPVKVAEGHESNCPWCGRELTTLFELDLTHSALEFLEIDGARVRIATCHVCTCYGFVYTKVDWDGTAKWSPHNRRPEYLPDDSADWGSLPAKCLVLGESPRNPYSAASEFVPLSLSQVGGHPSWIQDFSYPVCPECNKLMDFIAQLANEDIEEYGEGIYYAFLCRDCRNACTCYQQT